MSETWRAVPDDDRPDMFWNVVTDKGVRIATEMTEEDAKLLAAAPEVREALKPFANEAAHWDGDAPDRRNLYGRTADGEIEPTTLTLGDLRRARSALAKSRPDVAGGS